MADLQHVRPPRSSFGGHGALIGSIVVIGVLLAAVKPWGGTGGPPAATLFPTASLAGADVPGEGVTVTQAPTPAGFDLRYRPDLFGPEPPARWGLWPAGYITTYGFALPVPPEASPAASPTTAPGRSPGASSIASATAGPTGSPGAAPSGSSVAVGAPAWPARIAITAGNHLLVLGISTPVGYHVPEVKLFRSAADGTSSLVETEILPSPWPDHFTVIGIRARTADGSLEVWPDGQYRLDWRTEPGAIRQSIELQVRSGGADSPAP